MLADGVNGADNTIADLEVSRTLSPTGHYGFCTSFFYHFYGSNLGSLSLVSTSEHYGETIVSLFHYLYLLT